MLVQCYLHSTALGGSSRNVGCPPPGGRETGSGCNVTTKEHVCFVFKDIENVEFRPILMARFHLSNSPKQLRSQDRGMPGSLQ